MQKSRLQGKDWRRMACFDPKKSIIHSMLVVIVNGQPGMNDSMKDFDGTRSSKNVCCKVRIKIGA